MQPRGFTLLELAVVLAVLGLATALVAPAGFRMIASWQRATQAEAVLGELAALPERSRRLGRDLTLGPGTLDRNRLPALPEGWTLQLDEPLTVRTNGACTPTRGALLAEGPPLRFTLEAPYCRVRLTAE